MRVRRLTPDDTDILRDVRLRALRDAPDAFWATYDREAAYSADDWRRWLSTAALFVAEDGTGAPAAGMAGGLADPRNPGVALLISMWVDPGHRGTGLADGLVAAVTDWAAAKELPTVRLNVVEHNDRARRCYLRLGFTPTGRRLFRERDERWELEMEAHLPVAGYDSQPTPS
ncbi:MAG: GNAT family N-acetyltransferase [Acidimicrobiia bacterium]